MALSLVTIRPRLSLLTSYFLEPRWWIAKKRIKKGEIQMNELIIVCPNCGCETTIGGTCPDCGTKDYTEAE